MSSFFYKAVRKNPPQKPNPKPSSPLLKVFLTLIAGGIPIFSKLSITSFIFRSSLAYGPPVDAITTYLVRLVLLWGLFLCVIGFF